MKKIERIEKKVRANADIMKGIAKVNSMDVECFINHAFRYISAIKENRMLCVIESVSRSGMSRNMRFMECKKNKGSNRHNYLNFWSLFKALGYAEMQQSQSFRIYGCGMDMVFHTNYTNIHILQRLGFMTKKECEHLAQQTPTVV